ncbi:hypothetical protein R1flu_029196 [Riccia fluitans]|uniref:O-fucosyltransferase family protein n=1 Tax=Riccia fluitans TaxID=41844 RepID=A0ABD1XPI0_9MARC
MRACENWRVNLRTAAVFPQGSGTLSAPLLQCRRHLDVVAPSSLTASSSDGRHHELIAADLQWCHERHLIALELLLTIAMDPESPTLSQQKPQKYVYADLLNPETYGQHAVQTASNVCFGFFVLAVLTFTAIAVSYQPGDPWLESNKSVIELMTVGGNATFKPDETVITTAEDTVPLSSGLPPAINSSEVDAEVAQAVKNGPCEVQGPINCSLPGVLFAVEKFNLQTFRSVDFYGYRTPVRGSADNECDVAWKYRSDKDGSPRMYRDFRRYVLAFRDTCDYEVKSMGDWHSGINARPTKMPRSNPGFEVGVDTIGDGLINTTESAFHTGKYLYYERGGDYCKPMAQYIWSLLCAMGEARYLNRTFVMDLDVCLPASDNYKGEDHQGNEPHKDFRFYYDFEHLRQNLAVIDQAQFLRAWRSWDSAHSKRKLGVLEVDVKTTPMDLMSQRSPIIKRTFRESVPNNYWYRVCEGEAEKVIKRPWELLWKSRRIDDIVLAICGKMGWDYDVVHVVRGDRINNKELWPNLDEDTSPEAIARKLDDTVAQGRNVYIATNEREEDYFDKLRGKWRISILDDFKELWSEGSEWYKETTELNGGKPVEFDGYMRVEVDTEVLYKAKKRIETFNDLTKDCKLGVGAC